MVDGGYFSAVSLGDPIARCREQVESDSDIIIDIIVCIKDEPDIDELDLESMRWETALDVYKRRKKISSFYSENESTWRIIRGYNDINFRLVIKPDGAPEEEGVFPLKANAEYMRKLMYSGYEDAMAAIYELDGQDEIETEFPNPYEKLYFDQLR